MKTRLAIGSSGARAGIWDLILVNVNFAQIKKEKSFKDYFSSGKMTSIMTVLLAYFQGSPNACSS